MKTMKMKRSLWVLLLNLSALYAGLYDGAAAGRGRVEYTLRNPDGVVVGCTRADKLVVETPALWTPQTPHLYRWEIRVRDRRGDVVGGYMLRVRIRSLAFDPQKGFILNGRPYPRKLMGADRHQDFAFVCNALSNNLHWRDSAAHPGVPLCGSRLSLYEHRNNQPSTPASLRRHALAQLRSPAGISSRSVLRRTDECVPATEALPVHVPCAG